MATEIRPELSEKNPYWIGKHRYYELKHFCLQYPIWKKAYNALLGLSSRPNDLDIFVKSGQVRSDPTARCAESRVSFAKRMELVEQAAIGTDGDLYPYILRGVTEGLSYAASGDERDKPPAKLKEMIDAGHLGMKTGQGFYSGYDTEAGNLDVGKK